MRAAQVNGDGLVVNVILIEEDQFDDFKPAVAPDDLIVCDDTVGPGHTYADGVFTAPEWVEPIPLPPPPGGPEVEHN